MIFKKELKPDKFLIPSNIWTKPDKFFVERKYKGKKSVPEYGINLSKKNLSRLVEFEFEKTIENYLK